MELIDDRYELVEVIASGGMATVWRARDIRLDRYVALKRPHPVPPGDPSAERLGQEARAAAAISHPNVVTVYDYGVDDSGPFLVMELVEGDTLVERPGVDPAEAIRIGAQLADGLGAIHEAGIVHRDVKPANVIMSERGPLLTDFGIALDPDETKRLTSPGQVVATPSYAAPEVLRGDSPTRESDVYSLAVTVRELTRGGSSDDDHSLAVVLGPALSPEPSDRPSASEFARRLRSRAPTMTAVAGSGSTMVMETSPATSSAGSGDDEQSPNRRWLIVAVIAVLALTVVAIATVIPDRETPGGAASAATETTTSTSVAVTSTTAGTTSTTATTSTVTTTPASSAAAVAELRDELETILLEEPRSDMNPRDVEDAMKKVDEAIAGVEEGDLEKAERELSDTARRVEDQLVGDNQARAMGALKDLADFLGVQLELADREDDDDDDDD